MAAARFCSECGERLKVKRPAVLPLRAFCSRCSPRFRTVRLVMAAALVLATIAFAVSRFGGQREPFYLIGTPIESSLSDRSPSANDPPSSSSRFNESSRSIERAGQSASASIEICGAPTRSGKPCQRKVKGGGYCWQHREKSTQKSSTPRE